MKIRRIRIRNFRKLLGPVVIDGLGDGLTVIAGDNEEGKSTILAAVQTAFFNRHRLTGEAAQAMQPFGSALRPEIAIDFELDGGRYVLSKAFCQNPEAELTGPAGRAATGDAAEEWLQEMLRFAPPGRGAAKPEHRGIWGLFWVEQGTAFARPQIGDAGRETVVTALESEVGQVLGGERGRALIAAIARRRDALFTPTGRATGAYKEARDRVPALEQERDTLAAKVRDYEGKTDALAKLQARLRGYEDDHIVETAQEAVRRAREAEKALAEQEKALADATTDEKLALAALTAAQTAWKGRQEKIAAIASLVEQEKTCAETLQRKADGLKDNEAERDRLQSVYDAAKSAFRTAEAVRDAADRALQRARAQRELDEQQGHLDKAAAAQGDLATLRQEADRIRIDEAAVKALRDLQTAAEKARLRLDAIATRIRFAPDGARRVELDGTDIPADQPLLLTVETRLALEGFGALIVTPGGEDLGPLRRAADDAGERLTSALRRLGVADVADAERLLSRCADLLARAGAQQAVVAAHAPDGIDALRQRVGLKAAELAELSEGAVQDALDIPEAERQRNDAREACESFGKALATAENALKSAEAGHAASREAWLTAQADLTNAQRQRQDGEQALDNDRAEIADAQVRSALDRATDHHRQAVQRMTACEAAVEQANPEAVRLKLAMSEQALTRIEADIDKTTADARDLEAELRGLGQAGLGEQLAAKEGELVRAREHADRIDREAQATRLLLDTLRATERQAKETFLGPVRARITPYLKLLFPQAEVILADDDLAISHLRRDGVDEPFEHLSIGTREQLAVLTRLAFADFLQDKGRPAAVILDDALAYSDDERFECMQLVLRRAAERLQVIILTCRERDYLSLGEPIIRLADCKQDRSPVGSAPHPSDPS